MKPTTIEDVSEILSTFDLEEINTLIQTLLSFKEERYNDYFRPLYVDYKRIMESDTDKELKDKAEERFFSICRSFINEICKKFNLSIDDTLVDDNEEQLPALVTALYCFFVKDLAANIQEVCIGYINKNEKSIYEVFEERKNKKDAHTLVSKRNYPIELAVILANIYDASAWILQQLSEEEFIKYLHPDYSVLRIIDSLLQDGILAGEFMEVISEIYEECVNLKAEVCLNIISNFEKENI